MKAEAVVVSIDDLTKLAKMAEKSISLPEYELVEFVKNGAIRAYKAGAEGRANEDVSAEFNSETKQLQLTVRKLVVAAVLDKHKQCTADVAKAKIGSTVDLIISDKNSEKAILAAYSALKDLVVSEWKKHNALAAKTKYQELKGKCMPAVILGVDAQKISVTLGGGVEATLPKDEQLSEHNEVGTDIIVFVKEITNENELIVSRSQAGLISYLMRKNIPEVDAGNIEVKATARIAGTLSRAAVWSEDFAPIDRCKKRVEKLRVDLGGEEIDFVEWYSDPKAFIVSALKVEARKVQLIEKEKQALVEVFEDSINNNLDSAGITLRLAEELTGYKIEIKPVNREGDSIIGV